MSRRVAGYAPNVRWIKFDRRPRKPTFFEQVVDFYPSVQAVCASFGLGVALWGILNLVLHWVG